MITLENIQKSYFMGKLELKVLKGISLEILKNDYVALMGPSGSGKSTLMNILGCLDSPTKGKYILNGKDVSKTTDDDLAIVRNKEIGFVFQQFNLLPRLTAMENVALPLVYNGTMKKQRVIQSLAMLDRVGLSDRSTHKPNELSGGQGQRVAIARALVNNPSIILADEPTGNLDSARSHDIMRLLKDLNQQQGLTILMVTHEQAMASYCSRQIVFSDGRILQDQRLAA